MIPVCNLFEIFFHYGEEQIAIVSKNKRLLRMATVF